MINSTNNKQAQTFYHPQFPQDLDLSNYSVADWKEAAVLEVMARLLVMLFPYFTAGITTEKTLALFISCNSR